jgi:hypothetical protein
LAGRSLLGFNVIFCILLFLFGQQEIGLPIGSENEVVFNIKFKNCFLPREKIA